MATQQEPIAEVTDEQWRCYLFGYLSVALGKDHSPKWMDYPAMNELHAYALGVATAKAGMVPRRETLLKNGDILFTIAP